jgi:hypothetical protein
MQSHSEYFVNFLKYTPCIYISPHIFAEFPSLAQKSKQKKNREYKKFVENNEFLESGTEFEPLNIPANRQRTAGKALQSKNTIQVPAL